MKDENGGTAADSNRRVDGVLDPKASSSAHPNGSSSSLDDLPDEDTWVWQSHGPDTTSLIIAGLYVAIGAYCIWSGYRIVRREFKGDTK